MSGSAWLVAVRPKTLLVGATPVIVGTALAGSLGAVRPLPGALALVAALLLQVASNLANDVYDAERGADTEARLGPPRAVSSGLLGAAAVKRALVGCLAAALGVGLALTALTGWPVLAIGLAGMVSAVAYTGGPYPLGYHGLGDLFVFAFFGLLATAGTVFVHTGAWPATGWALGGALGCFGVGVLTVNNVRDLDTDAAVGKRTMAVRLGRAGALRWFQASLLAPYALVAGLAAGGMPATLLAGLTLPGALRLIRTVRDHRDGPTLNASLGGVARLQAAFGALVALGLLLG